MALSSKYQIILITCIVALGGFIFGVDSGIIATTIAHASFTKYMYGAGGANPALTGALVSGYNAGQAVGTFISGWTADRFSRRYSLAGAAGLATIAGAIQAGSVNIGMLIAGRALAGIACGMLLALVPIYIAEISPPKRRGFLVGMQGLMSAIGFFVSNWIGYAGQFAYDQAQWRIPLAMQCPGPMVMFIGCFFIPFSPRWLVKQERYEEARRVLDNLQGHLGQEFVDREFIQIQEQITFETGQKTLVWYKAAQVLFSRQYARRTLLAAFIVTMSQLGGTAVLSNFQSIFYSIVGISGTTSLLVSGVFGCMGVIGTAVYLIWVADKWPRTTTLWVGSLLLAITLAICMALSAVYPAGSTNKSGGYAAIAFIFINSFIFSMFFNALIYAASSELFPHFLRSSGMSVAVWTKAVIAIVISQITPVAIRNISWRYYSVFIAINLTAAVVFYCFLPETKGKTLEEIAGLFGDELVTNPLDQIDVHTKQDVVHRAETSHVEQSQGAVRKSVV